MRRMQLPVKNKQSTQHSRQLFSLSSRKQSTKLVALSCSTNLHAKGPAFATTMPTACRDLYQNVVRRSTLQLSAAIWYPCTDLSCKDASVKEWRQQLLLDITRPYIRLRMILRQWRSLLRLLVWTYVRLFALRESSIESP